MSLHGLEFQQRTTDLTDLRARFSRLYAGVVYDAVRFDLHAPQPFVVDRAVAPAWPMPRGAVLFGPAFTCRGERVSEAAHINDRVRIEMFRQFTGGCVQVIDAGGDATVAHFGDISGRLAVKFGAVGAVIDGFTRDLRRIEEDAFPLFCRGAQPQDAYGRWQIATYQEPVTLAGPEGPVRVAPGDYIFADADGVLVLPQRAIEDVLVFAEARSEREEEVRRRLRETDDVQSLYDEIGRW